MGIYGKDGKGVAYAKEQGCEEGKANFIGWTSGGCLGYTWFKDIPLDDKNSVWKQPDANNNKLYTLEFTAPKAGIYEVHVKANSFKDRVGNGNLESEKFRWTYETEVAPSGGWNWDPMPYREEIYNKPGTVQDPWVNGKDRSKDFYYKTKAETNPKECYTTKSDEIKCPGLTRTRFGYVPSDS